ncbi:Uncharacterised protein [Serratia fonticola]|uniref:hypothetical protein n=1 Tax=Serratia fonticola TaxID=47917 RepID=UPI0021829600|nr:hypothetical protein [Serratia fonticola]CAI2111897.1 Uncharacterised protein [Serratia fonticola]
MAAKKLIKKPVKTPAKKAADAKVKARSRRKIQKEFGQPMEIHMQDITKARLNEICKLLGHGNIDSMIRGTGRVYSQVLDELINLFYLYEVLTFDKTKAKALYDVYDEFYDLKFYQGKTLEEIVSYMTKHKRGRPSDLDDTEWTEKDVERLSSARRVVDNVLKLEKASDK